MSTVTITITVTETGLNTNDPSVVANLVRRVANDIDMQGSPTTSGETITNNLDAVSTSTVYTVAVT